MSFSFRQKTNSKLTFLDVDISPQQGKFVTTTYRKPTFSSLYTHLDSFLPLAYKVDMIYTQADRYFKICSDGQTFM